MPRHAAGDDEGAAAGLADALEARGRRGAAAGRLGRGTQPMARACVGGADLPERVRRCRSAGGGLPFLVEEVLARLIRDGTLVVRNGRGKRHPSTGRQCLPRSLTPCAGGSRGLNPTRDGRSAAAAVLGRRFDWATARPATGLPKKRRGAALRRGVGLQLVVADRDSSGSGTHSLMRQCSPGYSRPNELCCPAMRSPRSRRLIRLAGRLVHPRRRTGAGGGGTERAALCCSNRGGETSRSARWPAPSTR